MIVWSFLKKKHKAKLDAGGGVHAYFMGARIRLSHWICKLALLKVAHSPLSLYCALVMHFLKHTVVECLVLTGKSYRPQFESGRRLSVVSRHRQDWRN